MPRFFLNIIICVAFVMGLTLPEVWAQNPPSPSLSSQSRLALVIGNAAYPSAKLTNPVHDSQDVATILEELGFEVIRLENAGKKQMEESIRQFGKKLRSVKIGLFYYAGHGMQVHGNNYLIPTDAKIDGESDIPYEAVDAGRIVGKMHDAGNDLNILILDACRDNPFATGYRSGSKGLARMDAPQGTLIAYATAPGDVAADGNDRNGVYTKHLLQNITRPGIMAEQIFKKTRVGVLVETEGRQIPWESTSLTGDFFFKPTDGPSAQAPQPEDTQVAEHVKQGNQALSDGRVDEAKRSFRQALDSSAEFDESSTEALLGLGRAASLDGEESTASAYYGAVNDVDSTNTQGLVSQAVLLDSAGRKTEALALLENASETNPNDRIVAAYADELRKSLAARQDNARKQRIDALVQDLLEKKKQAKKAPPHDGWTSRPLTAWIMDFDSQGFCLKEGEQRLISVGLTDMMLEHGRFHPVERALLEAILEELTLSSSDLADKQTALSLGKLMAARLMVTGTLTCWGDDKRVSVRVIDTETGRILASANASQPSRVPPFVLAEELSGTLLKKVLKKLPLQGKVLGVKGDEITLNIGEQQGVETDQIFRTVDGDSTIIIVSTQATQCIAKAATENTPPQKGSRVRIMAGSTLH